MIFKSLELLALISEEQTYKVSLEYSSIFDMIEELRSDCIFCDLSIRDFGDLQATYPDNVHISLDKIEIDISNVYKIFQHDYMWEERPESSKRKIIKSYKKFFMDDGK